LKPELQQKSIQYACHMAQLCALPVTVVDPVEGRLVFSTLSEQDSFCSRCGCEKCNKLSPYLYGAQEAFRWDGQYTYYCPRGLTFICASILDTDYSLTGALSAGPFFMGDAEDIPLEQPDYPRTEGDALPLLSCKQANDYISLLCAVSTYVSGVMNLQQGGELLEKTRLLNSVYDAHEINDRSAALVYQLQYEKQLHDLILAQDKHGAQTVLNEVLGYIYFSNDFDLERIRTRVIELLVLFSRSSIDAGANIQQVFAANDAYLVQIAQMKTLEDLSVWLTGVLHFFINTTFDYPAIKHSDVVYKCIEFIKKNYDQKISLDDIALNVALSRSYLSKLFKDETGSSLFSYINHVRIEKSKQLLLDDRLSLVDIAGACGFEDQSYFTKVFKRETGISPKRFRDNPVSNARLGPRPV